MITLQIHNQYRHPPTPCEVVWLTQQAAQDFCKAPALDRTSPSVSSSWAAWFFQIHACKGIKLRNNKFTFRQRDKAEDNKLKSNVLLTLCNLMHSCMFVNNVCLLMYWCKLCSDKFFKVLNLHCLHSNLQVTGALFFKVALWVHFDKKLLKNS